MKPQGKRTPALRVAFSEAPGSVAPSVEMRCGITPSLAPCQTPLKNATQSMATFEMSSRPLLQAECMNRYNWLVEGPVQPFNSGLFMASSILQDLQWRGLVADMANREELERLLAPDAAPVTVYAGFDPTADSLHLGHLIGL